MAKISIGPDRLSVKLEPLEALASLHPSFSIPGGQVRGAQVLDKNFWRSLGLRIPGTAIPGLIIAGTYLWKRDRAFVYWTRKSIPVQVNLDGSGKFDRIIIGVVGSRADAEALADRINMAITGC
jgi:hypothetical protein